jgi:hypothetical protein
MIFKSEEQFSKQSSSMVVRERGRIRDERD